LCRSTRSRCSRIQFTGDRSTSPGARGPRPAHAPRTFVLARAIRRVLAGERVVDPELATAALNADPNPLTSRERDALAATVDGSTVADVAGRLHLSESTVRNHLSAAIGKTGSGGDREDRSRDRIEAVRAARHNEWL
jgi:two-component system response regulator DesR